jgi:hypothetical protein
MASTFMQHYSRCVPRLVAREKRYRDERLAHSGQRLSELVEHLDPQERNLFIECLALLDRERTWTEHFNHYREMVTQHQETFRSQVQQARAIRLL